MGVVINSPVFVLELEAQLVQVSYGMVKINKFLNSYLDYA